MRERLQSSRVFALPLHASNNGTKTGPERPESRCKIGRLVTVGIQPEAIESSTRAPFAALVDGLPVTILVQELGDEFLLYSINGRLHGAKSKDGGIGYSIEYTQKSDNPAHTNYSLIAIDGSEDATANNFNQVLEVIRDYNARNRANDMQRLDQVDQDAQFVDIRVTTAHQIAAILGVWAAAVGIAYVSISTRTPKSPDTHSISAPAKPDQQQPGAQQLAPATAPDAGTAVPSQPTPYVK